MAGSGITFKGTNLQYGQYQQLFKSLSELPKGLYKIHMRAAMKRMLKDYYPIFRNAAPKGSGKLRKSVMSATYFDPPDGSPVGKVGYGRAKGKAGYHAILIDAGTKDRYTKKKFRAYRGRGPASHFSSALASAINGVAPPKFEAEMQVALNNALKALPTYMTKSAQIKARFGAP